MFYVDLKDVKTEALERMYETALKTYYRANDELRPIEKEYISLKGTCDNCLIELNKIKAEISLRQEEISLRATCGS